jgi:hypothetical protein
MGASLVDLKARIGPKLGPRVSGARGDARSVTTSLLESSPGLKFNMCSAAPAAFITWTLDMHVVVRRPRNCPSKHVYNGWCSCSKRPAKWLKDESLRQPRGLNRTHLCTISPGGLKSPSVSKYRMNSSGFVV